MFWTFYTLNSSKSLILEKIFVIYLVFRERLKTGSQFFETRQANTLGGGLSRRKPNHCVCYPIGQRREEAYSSPESIIISLTSLQKHSTEVLLKVMASVLQCKSGLHVLSYCHKRWRWDSDVGRVTVPMWRGIPETEGVGKRWLCVAATKQEITRRRKKLTDNKGH